MRMALGSGDLLQRLLDDIVDAAVKQMDSLPQDAAALERQVQEGELIDGADRVTLILDLPGYGDHDLSVAVSDGGVEIRAPDFMMMRQLPPDVDLSVFESRYSNGVLSVRIEKVH